MDDEACTMGFVRGHRLVVYAMLFNAALSAHSYRVGCGELSQYVSMTDQIINEARYSYMVGRVTESEPTVDRDVHMEDYIAHMERARVSLGEVWRSKSCIDGGV